MNHPIPASLRASIRAQAEQAAAEIIAGDEVVHCVVCNAATRRRSVRAEMCLDCFSFQEELFERFYNTLLSAAANVAFDTGRGMVGAQLAPEIIAEARIHADAVLQELRGMR